MERIGFMKRIRKDIKEIGKCAYCRDPIYDSQATVKVGREKLHRGCLHILAEENLLDKEL